MTIEATAAALATESAVSEDQVATEAPAPTEDDELSAVWDKSQEEVEDQTPDEQDGKAEAEAEAAEEPSDEDEEGAEEAVEAPSDLPRSIRDHWKSMPEEARTAIHQAHQDMNRRLSDQGRQIQGLNPIREVLLNATQRLPALANMRPEQVAQEVMQQANLLQGLHDNPVGTVMEFVRQHGMESALKQALDGQHPGQSQQNEITLQREIQNLKRQVQDLSDPERLRETVANTMSQQQTVSAVEEFASKADHWDAVEPHIPSAIALVRAKLGDGASPQDVLSQAYELAVGQFVPEAAKAKQDEAAHKAAAIADPEKTKAGIKAKSVNVRSKATGKFREMTEDEALSAAFDRMQH